MSTKRMWFRFGCILLLLLLVASFGGVILYENMKGITVGKVERLVTQAGLSPGSSRAQVETWLDSQRMDHDYYKSLAEGEEWFVRQTAREVSGLANREVGGYVRARIRDAVVVPYFPWWGGEIWIYFFIDQDGKLIKHAVRAWEYSL